MTTIRTHKVIIDRLYYGRSSELTPEFKHYHVNDFLAEMQKDWQECKSIYAQLCDFVHPNFGSNYLVSSGELAEGELGRPAAFYSAETSFAANAVMKCLWLAERYELEGIGKLLALGNRVQIASLPTQQPTGIFSDRPPRADNDGSSKENAIQFENARTAFEFSDMLQRYLLDKKLAKVGPRQIVGPDDGFWYEIYPCAPGNIWFKRPVALKT